MGRVDYKSAISNCYNTGSVSGDYSVGGVAGEALYGTVGNCYNIGSVSGSNYVGGIMGNAISSIVSNCYNTGSVGGYYAVGGIMGNAIRSSTVSNCYNTGSVSGSNYVGGVAGQVDDSTVSNCYNTGFVSCDYYVGGVVGYAGSGGTVSNCYYSGYTIGIYNKDDTAGTAIPFISARLASSSIKVGGNTTASIGADNTESAITILQSVFGGNFSSSFEEGAFSNSNAKVATVSSSTVTGIGVGKATISGGILTITQPELDVVNGCWSTT